MNKLKEVKTRVFAVEALSLLKEDKPYKKLTKDLELSTPVLSRYVNGHVLPKLERAKKIIEYFEDQKFREMLDSRVIVKEDDTLNVMPLIQSTKLLETMGKYVTTKFGSVDKVLTAETDGIPIAVQVANHYGTKLVIAKEKQELGVDEFLEERCSISPTIKYLNIPKDSIKEGEKVLIVDDLIRSGQTIETLIRFVKRSDAEVAGVFTAVSVDGGMRKLKERSDLNCDFDSLLKF